MKRLVCAASTLAVLALILGAGGAQDQPSIKDVMGKLHKGATSPLAKLKTTLKSDSPDWKVVQSLSKQFVTLTGSLEKGEPPRGDRAGYERLARAYASDAKELNDAAKAEDTTKTREALKISVSCKACHSAHKGE